MFRSIHVKASPAARAAQLKFFYRLQRNPSCIWPAFEAGSAQSIIVLLNRRSNPANFGHDDAFPLDKTHAS
jgi:hypothetical protein